MTVFDRIMQGLFGVAAFSLIFGAGALVHERTGFPIEPLRKAYGDLKGQLFPMRPGYIFSRHEPGRAAATLRLPGREAEGLILTMSVQQDRRNVVSVLNRKGEAVHRFELRWSEIWGPDEGNFADFRRPKSDPGAFLHGMTLLPSRDIVLNYENLSTMRVNLCGDVVWKLDNHGHHSVFLGEDGLLWASAMEYVDEGAADTPAHRAPYWKPKAQQITQDGEIVRTIDLIDLLLANGFDSLVYLVNFGDDFLATGDTLHLNDIEAYPSSFTSDIFAAGDLVVSLRNIHTIFVFDPETLEIKYVSSHHALRQHDPDFIGGDLISFFDNRIRYRDGRPDASRIAVLDAATGEVTTVVDGAGPSPFFSYAMGVHELLPNGNYLITSSLQGRVLEVAPDQSLVWEYNNIVTDELNGNISMATLLPPDMDEAWFAALAQRCAAGN